MNIMQLSKKVKQAIPSFIKKRSYKNALDYIRRLICSEDDNDKKLLILDYILNVIKRDLHAEFQAALFYEGDNVRKINTPFPTFYRNENGDSLCIEIKNKYKEIDLSKDCIFALPWKSLSVIRTINMLSEIDFEYIKTSHRALYYYPIDICYIWNGIHSISLGMYFKKGTIEANYCDITPLFNNIATDGAHWYNVHTNTIIDDLYDFRTGLLFEVARMKYNIECKNLNIDI